MITKYVGPKGIRSSNSGMRLQTPHPGDLVRFPDGHLGRIWEVGTGYCDPDEVHFCCELGSAYLGMVEGRVYVSISGGPFRMVKRSRLEPTWTTAPSLFWNWGDNLAGAGQGVEYILIRPVFRLIEEAS